MAGLPPKLLRKGGTRSAGRSGSGKEGVLSFLHGHAVVVVLVALQQLFQQNRQDNFFVVLLDIRKELTPPPLSPLLPALEVQNEGVKRSARRVWFVPSRPQNEQVALWV